MNGFTDKPTEKLDDDAFGVKQYISGLSDFILNCYTPMTIAIQGDWGSGKTSMMNMIREQLGKKVITTWFNTWQYSQFNMGDALALSFLSRLISELESEQDKKSESSKKIFKTLFYVAKNIGVVAASAFIGEKAAEVVEKGGVDNSDEKSIDIAQAIHDLKTQFQITVDNKLVKEGKDRLVIFIDDLDRLHPGKAVELLEVLKLFLDCDKCIFVLAIDYGVVSQGVKQKYGELIGEEKGKSFFDKIIQVPFKMPVAQYNVKSYVSTALKTLGMAVSESEAEAYEKLIRKSVGCNPRAMKRLFNAFLLLNKIAENGTIMEASQRKMLFAILCLQMSFENVYNYIVQNAKDCNAEFLKSLTLTEKYNEGNEAERLSRELHLNNDDDILNVVDFMTVFVSVIDNSNNGNIEEEEISTFLDTLRFSTITATTSNSTNNEDNLESQYRYYNRDIIKDVLNNIQGNINTPFKIYQTRTNNDSNWKKYYAGGWKYVEVTFGKVYINFKIATDLQKQESVLSIWVGAYDKTDRSKFLDCTKEWFAEQKYGFTYLEKECGYWLDNKTVKADSRDEIIEYFSDIVPKITSEIEKCFEMQ